MKYIKVPESISYNEIMEKNYSFSSSQYEKLIIKNKNMVPVSWFLKEDLANVHKGKEIGTENYIKKSTHYFMRTKALQGYNYIPDFNSEGLLPMKPQKFIDCNLKENDIIISKDGNIGETVMLDNDYPNIMLSGALYNLPVKDKYRYYLFSFLKHDFFREQLDVLVPKGATIRHAKKLFLDCLIPVPTEENVIKITRLVKSIIKKEKLIKKRYNDTLAFIEKELDSNKKNNNFKFSNPKFREINTLARLDTGMYNKKFKSTMFKIDNYYNGSATIEELGFTLSRGQNLQVSNIGKSIYSDKKYDNFYTLILPKYLSKYGTVNKISYLGNEKNLKTLELGDIIFGAEGFGKGRSLVVASEMEKTITNIRGITIKQVNNHNLNKGIFVKQILDYLRDKGIIDMMAVGGNGGSLAQRYWKYLRFPKFSGDVINDMAKLYYNPICSDYHVNEIINSDNCEYDNEFNSLAGILNLDLAIKKIKNEIDKQLDEIINSYM